MSSLVDVSEFQAQAQILAKKISDATAEDSLDATLEAVACGAGEIGGGQEHEEPDWILPSMDWVQEMGTRNKQGQVVIAPHTDTELDDTPAFVVCKQEDVHTVAMDYRADNMWDAPSTASDLPVRASHYTGEPKEWRSYHLEGGSVEKNGDLRLPPIDVDGVSDFEHWVQAGDGSANPTRSQIPAVSLDWYIDELKRFMSKPCAKSDDGTKAADRLAALRYTFLTFVPGRPCLFCLCATRVDLPFMKKWGDIGRFARHLYEFHTPIVWEFKCCITKDGEVSCRTRGALMKEPYRTLRRGLFLRHLVANGGGHRYNMTRTRRILNQVWHRDEHLRPQDDANRRWSLTAKVNTEVAFFLREDHFKAAKEYFYDPIEDKHEEASKIIESQFTKHIQNTNIKEEHDVPKKKRKKTNKYYNVDPDPFDYENPWKVAEMMANDWSSHASTIFPEFYTRPQPVNSSEVSSSSKIRKAKGAGKSTEAGSKSSLLKSKCYKTSTEKHLVDKNPSNCDGTNLLPLQEWRLQSGTLDPQLAIPSTGKLRSMITIPYADALLRQQLGSADMMTVQFCEELNRQVQLAERRIEARLQVSSKTKSNIPSSNPEVAILEGEINRLNRVLANRTKLLETKLARSQALVSQYERKFNDVFSTPLHEWNGSFGDLFSDCHEPELVAMLRDGGYDVHRSMNATSVLMAPVDFNIDKSMSTLENGNGSYASIQVTNINGAGNAEGELNNVEFIPTV